MESRIEKRRESRSNQRYPVTIRALPEGAAQAAETLDVSAQGASLRAPFSLPVGGLVRVAMRGTEGGADARIVRCTPQGGQFIIGLEFTGAAPHWPAVSAAKA